MISELEYANALCRENFDAFAQRAFAEIEPGVPYEWSWHIECICWHLQALFEGTLPEGKRRLCINVPPRSLKSYLASIAFPAWVLGKEASQKFIATSFNATLAKEMSQKSRILIESEWYKQLFPEMRIDDNQNEKHNFWSTKRGMYYSSALMSVTGRGAGYVLLDDPISPKEAISDTIRQDTNATIRSTIPTRFNDLRNDKWVLIMQRIHEDDPTGHFALKDPRWYILKLPGENRSDKPISYELNGRTWTMQSGQLLFPERLTKQVLEDLRTDLGEYNYAGQILQEPVPVGGGDFNQNWIQYYAPGACKPKEMNVVILVDPAGGDELNKKKKKLSDWTAMVVVGFAPDNNKYVLDIIRDRLNPTERVNMLFALHRKWNTLTGKSPKVGYEKYGMMSDTHYIDIKKREEAYNFPLIILGGNMPKEERIKQLIPDLQNGHLFFPQSLIYVDGEGRKFDLVSEIINSEMASFPRARHDDMIDALSRMYEPELCMTFPKSRLGMVQKARIASYRDETQSWTDF